MEAEETAAEDMPADLSQRNSPVKGAELPNLAQTSVVSCHAG